MTKNNRTISLGTAALITGLTLFIPTAPYAEFYVFKTLIVYNDGAQTTQNLVNNPTLFLNGIFAIFFTYIKDILIAWTLYIFLKPVNPLISLLASWFRLVYTGLAIVALLNFLNAFQLINTPFSEINTTINDQVIHLVNARRLAMNFAYIIFGIYLAIVGALIIKSSYIPKILGILITLSGVSWIITSLRPFFFINYDLSWLIYFSVGELFFAIWLLVKGSRIKESEVITT